MSDDEWVPKFVSNSSQNKLFLVSPSRTTTTNRKRSKFESPSSTPVLGSTPLWRRDSRTLQKSLSPGCGHDEEANRSCREERKSDASLSSMVPTPKPILEGRSDAQQLMKPRQSSVSFASDELVRQGRDMGGNAGKPSEKTTRKPSDKCRSSPFSGRGRRGHETYFGSVPDECGASAMDRQGVAALSARHRIASAGGKSKGSGGGDYGPSAQLDNRELKPRPFSAKLCSEIDKTDKHTNATDNRSRWLSDTRAAPNRSPNKNLSTAAVVRRDTAAPSKWIAIYGFPCSMWSSVKAYLEAFIGVIDAWILTDEGVHFARFRTMAMTQRCILMSKFTVCSFSLRIAWPATANMSFVILDYFGNLPRTDNGLLDFSDAETQSSREWCYPDPAPYRSNPKKLPLFCGFYLRESRLQLLKRYLSPFFWLSPFID